MGTRRVSTAGVGRGSVPTEVEVRLDQGDGFVLLVATFYLQLGCGEGLFHGLSLVK